MASTQSHKDRLLACGDLEEEQVPRLRRILRFRMEGICSTNISQKLISKKQIVQI